MMSHQLPPAFHTTQFSHPNYGNQPPYKRAKLKHVSWAPDDALCEVRIFSIEDSPCMANGNGQKQPVTKSTSFPPGFAPVGTKRVRSDSVAVAAMEPQTSWTSPQKIKTDSSWGLVAGEESQEVQIQQQREKRSFEAIYPRFSSIPESPAEPLEPLEVYDEALIPTIPVVAVEDDTPESGSYVAPAVASPGREQTPDSTLVAQSEKEESSAMPAVNCSRKHTVSDSVPSELAQSVSTMSENSLSSNPSPEIAAAAAAAVASVYESGIVDPELLAKTIAALTANQNGLNFKSANFSSTSVLGNAESEKSAANVGPPRLQIPGTRDQFHVSARSSSAPSEVASELGTRDNLAASKSASFTGNRDGEFCGPSHTSLAANYVVQSNEIGSQSSSSSASHQFSSLPSMSPNHDRQQMQLPLHSSMGGQERPPNFPFRPGPFPSHVKTIGPFQGSPVVSQVGNGPEHSSYPSPTQSLTQDTPIRILTNETFQGPFPHVRPPPPGAFIPGPPGRVPNPRGETLAPTHPDVKSFPHSSNQQQQVGPHGPLTQSPSRGPAPWSPDSGNRPAEGASSVNGSSSRPRPPAMHWVTRVEAIGAGQGGPRPTMFEQGPMGFEQGPGVPFGGRGGAFEIEGIGGPGGRGRGRGHPHFDSMGRGGPDMTHGGGRGGYPRFDNGMGPPQGFDGGIGRGAPMNDEGRGRGGPDLSGGRGRLGVEYDAGGGRKYCVYFNSPNGCRNGPSCGFLHELIDERKFG